MSDEENPINESVAWENARHSLAVAICSFVTRPDNNRGLNAAAQMLDVITEPGSPLAWLRTISQLTTIGDELRAFQKATSCQTAADLLDKAILEKARATVAQAGASEPVAYTHPARLKKLASGKAECETVWAKSLLSDGDIPLYTASVVEQVGSLPAADLDEAFETWRKREYSWTSAISDGIAMSRDAWQAGVDWMARRAASLPAEVAQALAEGVPVAWVRFLRDGLYEAPIMNCDKRRMDEIVRPKIGKWTALGPIGEAVAQASASEPVAASSQEPVELRDVPRILTSGDGVWRSCSGCYDTEDGHPTAHYPYSTVLRCALGSGCSECGGIGAVWDGTDYSAMCDAIALVGDETSNPGTDAAPVMGQADSSSPDLNELLEAAALGLMRAGMMESMRVVRGMKPGYPPGVASPLVGKTGPCHPAPEPLKLSDDVRAYLQEGINNTDPAEEGDYEFAKQLGMLLDPLYAVPVVEQVDAQTDLEAVYAVFHIGEQAHSIQTLLANCVNARRRSDCLSGIELLFTYEAPAEDLPGEMMEECDLNWGHDRTQYVAAFKTALPAFLARHPEYLPAAAPGTTTIALPPAGETPEAAATPNQRRALKKGLAALEAMADLWGVEIHLSQIAALLPVIPGTAERSRRIAAMVLQGFMEGAYRHFLDSKDAEQPGGVLTIEQRDAIDWAITKAEVGKPTHPYVAKALRALLAAQPTTLVEPSDCIAALERMLSGERGQREIWKARAKEWADRYHDLEAAMHQTVGEENEASAMAGKPNLTDEQREALKFAIQLFSPAQTIQHGAKVAALLVLLQGAKP